MKKVKIVRLTVQYYHQQEQKLLAAAFPETGYTW